MESYRLKLSGIAGIDLNPASNKQMGEYLYGKLGLPIQRNRKTGEQTVDENAINSLSAKHPQHAEFFSNLLEWRERQKLISTYLEIPLTLDNRLTTSFNCVGTVNGRCNSSKTLWGTGTNLQNIPKRSALGRPLRRMFIADPGYTIIKADLSQAQFRAVCWLGKMQRLMDRYLQNPKFDVHKWVASLIYRVEEVQVIDDQRNIAKNGVYGGTFHMMPKTAAVTYKIPLAEATFVLNAFWKALPEIPLWWKQVEHAINTTRTLVSPHGRVRSFMGRIDDSLYRDAYAFCPQAIEADIIHRAIILSESLLLHAEAVLQIHDEIVFSCRTEHLGDTLPLIKTIMEQPIFFEGVKEPLIIPSDVSYGPNWLDQTKWKG
jgi:DNA polymerase-1